MLALSVFLTAVTDQPDGGSGLAPLVISMVGAVVIAIIGAAATVVAARSKPPTTPAATPPPPPIKRTASSLLDEQAAHGITFAMTELEKALERCTRRAETAEARLEASQVRVRELEDELRARP